LAFFLALNSLPLQGLYLAPALIGLDAQPTQKYLSIRENSHEVLGRKKQAERQASDPNLIV